MTGIIHHSPVLAEVFSERMRQVERFGHSTDADFDAYWNAQGGRTRLASFAVRYSDGALDHLSVGSLKSARHLALQAAAINVALVELIDRVIEYTAGATADTGNAE